MDDVKFEREDRYAVFKFSDMDEAQMRILHDTICRLPRRQCVVVESDWPEYGPVWQSIERRVTGNDVPAAETMGYSVFGNRYMIALTQQEILDHSQSYAGCMFELVARSELDAQRLRADTAEAERGAARQALDATRDALESAQYSNAELASKLEDRDQLFSDLVNSQHAVSVPLELWKRIKVFAGAGPNPKPEAGSHE